MRHIGSDRHRGGFTMIRADAAGALARADLFRDRQARSSHFETRDPAYLKFEPWLRLAVPALVGLFATALTAMIVVLLLQAHDRAIAAAVDDLELIAATTARDLSVAARPGMDRDATAALLGALPAQALAHGRKVFLSDSNGTIIVASPHQLRAGALLADQFGGEPPLRRLAGATDVMRVYLADGTDALVAARVLAAPFGRVVFVHPISAVLADWRDGAVRMGAALVATLVVLCSVAAAYFWQAARARKAD